MIFDQIRVLKNIDTIIVANAPVRIDLAGGWSDTPPICYETAGAVSFSKTYIEFHFSPHYLTHHHNSEASRGYHEEIVTLDANKKIEVQLRSKFQRIRMGYPGLPKVVNI